MTGPHPTIAARPGRRCPRTAIVAAAHRALPGAMFPSGRPRISPVESTARVGLFGVAAPDAGGCTTIRVLIKSAPGCSPLLAGFSYAP